MCLWMASSDRAAQPMLQLSQGDQETQNWFHIIYLTRLFHDADARGYSAPS